MNSMLLLLCGGSVFVLVLALVGALVIWVARSSSRSANRGESTVTQEPASRGRALALLRERYARGEITKEQYDQMRLGLGA